MNRALEGLATLTRSVQSLPSCLERALAAELPGFESRPRTVVTTGIGASEPPARMLASRLVEAGIAARFCPTSSFLLDAPAADLLVVFSQGLSPNARLAFGTRTFAARWLVTSVCAESDDASASRLLDRLRAEGVRTLVVPPPRESGMLVRLVGPTVAMLAALRIAAQLSGDEALQARLEGAASAYRVDLEERRVLEGPLALVTAGVASEVALAQRWKLLEGLSVQDPPVWDVLQIAHGPLQSFHARPLTLIALATPRAESLLDRLESTLVPGRHGLMRAIATNDGPLSALEHAAHVDALLLSTLRADPRDLYDWPARGMDRPLYELGGD